VFAEAASNTDGGRRRRRRPRGLPEGWSVFALAGGGDRALAGPDVKKEEEGNVHGTRRCAVRGQERVKGGCLMRPSLGLLVVIQVAAAKSGSRRRGGDEFELCLGLRVCAVLEGDVAKGSCMRGLHHGDLALMVASAMKKGVDLTNHGGRVDGGAWWWCIGA